MFLWLFANWYFWPIRVLFPHDDWATSRPLSLRLPSIAGYRFINARHRISPQFSAICRPIVCCLWRNHVFIFIFIFFFFSVCSMLSQDTCRRTRFDERAQTIKNTITERGNQNYRKMQTAKPNLKTSAIGNTAQSDRRASLTSSCYRTWVGATCPPVDRTRVD